MFQEGPIKKIGRRNEGKVLEVAEVVVVVKHFKCSTYVGSSSDLSVLTWIFSDGANDCNPVHG